MADIPSQISTRLVKGRFAFAVADTADAQREPDLVAASGRVVFTPSASRIVVNDGVDPLTIIQSAIEVPLDNEGRLELQGEDGVRLVCTDDPDMNPSGWTWHVEIWLDGVAAWSFDFELPQSAEPLDLTIAAPVPAAGGVAIVVGPQGPPGPPGPPGSGATVGDADYGDIVVASGVWSVQDGVITVAKLSFDPATQAELDAVNTAAKNASNLTSGTVSAARLPAATTTAVGAVELATTAEAQGLSLTTLAVTPANLGALVQPINAQTGTAYTVVAADFVGLIGKLVTLTNAAEITVTLPTPTSLGLAAGSRCEFAVFGAGMATFVAGAGAALKVTPSAVSKDTNSGFTLVAVDGTTWWLTGRAA